MKNNAAADKIPWTLLIGINIEHIMRVHDTNPVTSKKVPWVLKSIFISSWYPLNKNLFAYTQCTNGDKSSAQPAIINKITDMIRNAKLLFIKTNSLWLFLYQYIQLFC